MTANEFSHIVIGKAIEVHTVLGPGLFERIYERALVAELENDGFAVQSQVELPVIYKGQDLDIGYRLDILVGKKLIIEVKSITTFDEIHMSQMMTYLKLTGCTLGLLINFNVPRLKHGIQRVVLGDPDQ